MKKRWIVLIVSLVVLIGGCGFLYNYLKNKNDNIEILYNDKLITKYKNNKLPFTIKCDEEVKVNGEKYNGEKIYEVGKYVIESGSFKKTVNIKKATGKTYNFYVTTATLATLYGALDMVAKDDEYSYIFYNRSNTLDKEDLKTNDNYFVSEYVGLSTYIDKNVIEEIKREINRILEKDSNARFHLYIDEFNYDVEFKTMATLGFNDERYDVTYITNGTISYVKPYVYLNDNSYDEYKKNKEEFTKLLDDVRKGDQYQKAIIENHVFIAASRDNANYYLQYPDYLEIKDKKTKEELKIDFIAKSPADLYNELSESKKKELLKYVGLDKEKMDEEYFNDNSKPYLILTGNNPMDYHYGRDGFKDMVKQVVAKYGNDYNIVFKPHPAALPDVEYQKFFEEMNIKILPGQMPMEVISFVYSDLKLGGFAGSLYMSAPTEAVMFFFASKPSDLFKPLDEMCETTFKNAIFIQPKKK